MSITLDEHDDMPSPRRTGRHGKRQACYPCKSCKGTGVKDISGWEVSCPACDGRGRQVGPARSMIVFNKRGTFNARDE